MKSQKFVGIEPKSCEPKMGSHPINFSLTKLILAMAAGVIVVTAGTIVFLTVNAEVATWKKSWSQIMFAKENPEIVAKVQRDYLLKLDGVKKDFTTQQETTYKIESSITIESPKE